MAEIGVRKVKVIVMKHTFLHRAMKSRLKRLVTCWNQDAAKVEVKVA